MLSLEKSFCCSTFVLFSRILLGSGKIFTTKFHQMIWLCFVAGCPDFAFKPQSPDRDLTRFSLPLWGGLNPWFGILLEFGIPGCSTHWCGHNTRWQKSEMFGASGVYRRQKFLVWASLSHEVVRVKSVFSDEKYVFSDGKSVFSDEGCFRRSICGVGARIQTQVCVLEQSYLSKPSQGLLTSISPAFF